MREGGGTGRGPAAVVITPVRYLTNVCVGAARVRGGRALHSHATGLPGHG